MARALHAGPMLVPLQMGLPGAPELLVILLIFLIPGLLVGLFVYRDATARESDWAWLWAVGITLLFVAGLVPGLLAVIIYLLVRGER